MYKINIDQLNLIKNILLDNNLLLSDLSNDKVVNNSDPMFSKLRVKDQIAENTELIEKLEKSYYLD